MKRLQWLAMGALCTVAGCSDDPAPAGDAGAAMRTDRGPELDASAPRAITDLPVQETLRLPNLESPVDVVVDRWGWPHIRGASLRDVARVQGFLLARDRMAQMDILRRLASGNLASRFGPLNSAVIETDLSFRVLGLRRAATAMWAQIQTGQSRERTLLEGFTEGVNHYLSQVRAGNVEVPAGSTVVVDDTTPEWSPVDSLVIGRYQSYSLSYDAEDDIANSSTLQRIREIFDGADAMTQPARAARRGMALDVIRWAPPSDAVIVSDFFPRAGGQALSYRPNVFRPALRSSVYRDAQRFLQLTRSGAEVLGDETRGSNNWVVTPQASASGHALLANDPHLSLTSPPIWWGTHLTVTAGPDAIDVAGTTFPGIPGVIIGFTNRIAWGVTTAGYDVTDVYQETIIPGGNGQPDRVRFNGQEVPIQVINEMVSDGLGTTLTVPIEVVPHHGPLVPRIANGRIQPRTGTTALSIKWTGHQPTNDLSAFVGVAYSRNVSEAMRAVENFGVGAQNWVLADIEGNTAYKSHAVIPVRAAGALTWSPARPEGTNPCTVLPGDGSAEWMGAVPANQIPQAVGSPQRPFIATANGDQAGVTLDNNPFDAPVYLGCNFASGWRQQRIAARLQGLNNRATRSDMESVQADTVVQAGAQMRPFLAQAMARLEMAWANPSSQPDLSALATSTTARQARLRDAAMRLAQWSLDGASGVGTATEMQRRDAVASSLFHGWVVRVLAGVFNDELSALRMDGLSVGWDRLRAVLHLLEHPDQLRARDTATMQSALWDDLSTADVNETRDYILLRALDETLTQLETLFMTNNVDNWLWGQQHTVRFNVLFAGLGPGVAIPGSGDPMFARGFPRPGGIDVVDASGPSTSSFNFNYGSGPSQRFTVEMDPAGPRAFNALPGGQSIDPSSAHHRDEAELWRVNRSHQVALAEADVVANAERRIRVERLP
ncbi:MAG: penicillin acylase family protein [Myxococcales bacterium]|nr:penicillin acylase family protein [Myxococcales bacterium]